jgi:catechol 2,3-dioxygenase-like lactoylglutathione lyase family enzyme
MLDHVSLGTANLARARKFYDAALKPLGYKMVWPVAGHGYGYGAVKDEPRFWVGLPRAKRLKPRSSAGTHVAFQAPSRKAVDAFYKAAIKAGARDNGKPGLRPEYHPTYYAAFVFDPEGHVLEAVCHKAE